MCTNKAGRLMRDHNSTQSVLGEGGENYTAVFVQMGGLCLLWQRMIRWWAGKTQAATNLTL